MLSQLVEKGKKLWNVNKCRRVKYNKYVENTEIAVNHREKPRFTQFLPIQILRKFMVIKDAYCTKKIRSCITMARSKFTKKS